MPQELLSFPPLYVVVGIYRLITDHGLRKAVWDKVKHATARGLLVGGTYLAVTYSTQRWFVKTFIVGGVFPFFGGKKQELVPTAVEKGLGWLKEMDIVEYTTILFILPQLSYLLHYFLRRNIHVALSRAWTLTVQSRHKPPEFWSKGYVEEYEVPPVIPGFEDGKGVKGERQEKWLQWVLWWPSQMAFRHYFLIPLSPYLPVLNVVFTSSLRALYTARVLHRSYFEAKGMTPLEVETWLEERKWGYRAFGFAATTLESIPIFGPYFSISNRIGAAMWAFDLEKRQHRFASGELKKVKPEELGVLGIVRPELPPREGDDFGGGGGGGGGEGIELAPLDPTGRLIVE